MSETKYPHGNIFYRRMSFDHPIITHGEGVHLYDEDGKKYIDGSGGAIVVNVGHGVKEIAKAISEQAAKAAYIHPTMFSAAPIEEYAAELAEIVPIEDSRFYFMTSGSEAVETAVKLARQIQVERGEIKRYLTISRWMSYHGATLGALGLTGKPKMRKLYQSMFKDMPHIPPPYCYRCPYNLEHPACGLKCAIALEEEILKQNPENVSAFLAEPISGATLGAAVPPDGYWPRIREICDQYGVLLIADEVMTGMGRTGKWFGVEQWNLKADLITIGKGAAGGYFPLSIVAVSKKFTDLIHRGRGDFSHGGTYSHHVVGAAAGKATLAYLKDKKLIENIPQKAELLSHLLAEKLAPLPGVGDIRGIGLMWGVEFVRDKESKAPFDPKIKLNQAIADTAFSHGLAIYPGGGSVDGHAGDHLMIGPPFCISEEEINQLVNILQQAVTAVISKYL
jgi:adenosylmethionine-8-amino-7-oxononanoate aminotransferase